MSETPGRAPPAAEPLPDPVAVLTRYWPLVAATAVLLAFVGAASAERQEPTYSATAAVVVEDARSRLFDRPTTDIERYVASQAAVIGSEPVAVAASEMLADGSPDVRLTPSELLAGLTVSVGEDADVVDVRVDAGSADAAERGATAIVAAYEKLVSSSIQDDLAGARGRLDDEIERVRDTLDESRRRVASLRSPATSDVGDIVASSSEALDPGGGATTTDSAERIASELAALRAISELEERDPELAAALQTQRDLELVLAELNDRRAALVADASLIGSGIAFATEAGPGMPNRFSTGAATLLAAVLGAGLGAAIAYVIVAWDVALPWRRQRRPLPGPPPDEDDEGGPHTGGQHPGGGGVRGPHDGGRSDAPTGDGPRPATQTVHPRGTRRGGITGPSHPGARGPGEAGNTLTGARFAWDGDSTATPEVAGLVEASPAGSTIPAGVPLLGIVVPDDRPSSPGDALVGAVTAAVRDASDGDPRSDRPVVVAVVAAEADTHELAHGLGVAISESAATHGRALRVELEPTDRAPTEQHPDDEGDPDLVAEVADGSPDVLGVPGEVATTGAAGLSSVALEGYDHVTVVLLANDPSTADVAAVLDPTVAIAVVTADAISDGMAACRRALCTPATPLVETHVPAAVPVRRPE